MSKSAENGFGAASRAALGDGHTSPFPHSGDDSRTASVDQEVAGFDDPIRPGDADFAASGLKAPSLIRLGFLAVLPASSLLGTIGSIDNVRHVRLLERLSNHLRPAAAATEATPEGG